MQKKIIALAVAGLSTAAFAQTNVTIYGVADVSAQGTNMSAGTARNNSTTGKAPQGGSFNLKSNSSLIGFKGTEDLGNGLKGLFQVETSVNLTGQTSSTQGVNAGSTAADGLGSLRDSYVGLNSKYGTVLGGFLSTPFRSALTSFDVMPGATGDGRIENMLGKIRTAPMTQALTTGVDYTYWLQADSSVRATALAYAMPTLYGFNGSIAYTGSNNNGTTNQTNVTVNSSSIAILPQSALSMNLGWSGYGVDIKGAFQQAKVNSTVPAGVGVVTSSGDVVGYSAANTSAQGYTSYLIGASYTGLPGLKASVVYNRNTIGLNNGATLLLPGGSAKGSNNALYVGASYRFGNNEPRLSWQHVSNTSGLGGNGYGAQDGATQWTANWGYYLSKRTQVYGIVSAIKNNANANYTMASGGTSINPSAGNNLITYGAGLRTNF